MSVCEFLRTTEKKRNVIHQKRRTSPKHFGKLFQPIHGTMPWRFDISRSSTNAVPQLVHFAKIGKATPRVVARTAGVPLLGIALTSLRGRHFLAQRRGQVIDKLRFRLAHGRYLTFDNSVSHYTQGNGQDSHPTKGKKDAKEASVHCGGTKVATPNCCKHHCSKAHAVIPGPWFKDKGAGNDRNGQTGHQSQETIQQM